MRVFRNKNYTFFKHYRKENLHKMLRCQILNYIHDTLNINYYVPTQFQFYLTILMVEHPKLCIDRKIQQLFFGKSEGY